MRHASTDIPTPLLEKLYRATTNPLRLLPDFVIIYELLGSDLDWDH